MPCGPNLGRRYKLSWHCQLEISWSRWSHPQCRNHQSNCWMYRWVSLQLFSSKMKYFSDIMFYGRDEILGIIMIHLLSVEPYFFTLYNQIHIHFRQLTHLYFSWSMIMLKSYFRFAVGVGAPASYDITCQATDETDAFSGKYTLVGVLPVCKRK